MNDIKSIVIDKYGSIEQLIQQGIWRGEIYNNNLLNEDNRGWLWKTIVLHSAMADDSSANLNITLMSVPIVSDSDESTPIVNKTLQNPKGSNRGMRRLTPMQTEINPLSDNSEGTNSGTETIGQDEGDELITMSLSDTLEIIDLDLSRLLLDPIFQKPKIHSEMRQILYNYIYSLQNNSENINSSVLRINKNYQQGFHELLGMIYLQLHNYSSKNFNQKTQDEESEIVLYDVFRIYKKLMQQMVPIFYTRLNLIEWENEKFKPILKICSKKLYEVLYIDNDDETNLIWLLRWVRLIFMRELPKDYVAIIWDHILTFQYPIDLFIVCLIMSLLLNIFEDLISDNNDIDNDDIIERLLHYEETVGEKLIDCVELCKMSGNLCELYMYENYNDMVCICDTFVKVRIGEETFTRLNSLKVNNKHSLKNKDTIDPNKERLEEKLRMRVRKITSTFRK